MELKEFIKTAVADITNAVSELQKELRNGAIVSPSLQNNNESTIVIDNKNMILTQVAFDVAITAGGTDTVRGGAKGGLHVFSASVDGSTEERTENISHVSFTIPIVLPQHRVRSEQEKADDNLANMKHAVHTLGSELREKERKASEKLKQTLPTTGPCLKDD